MRRVCAWCKTDMGAVPEESRSDAFITHGICRECINRYFPPMPTPLMDFLDTFEAPVMVVDDTVKICSANKRAKEILPREWPDAEDFRGGDVFECTYAKMPGGCGQTIHCDGCTIRMTVHDTFTTGKSHLNIPAYVLRGTPEAGQPIEFLISTEKVKEAVLLRIDHIGSPLGDRSVVV